MASLGRTMTLDVRNQAQFATIASQLANLGDNGIRNCSVIIGVAYIRLHNALPPTTLQTHLWAGDTDMKAIGPRKGRLLPLRAPRN